MPQENKMGVMPVNRLLITMSVPMMISMLVQALYNVVDSMFVAQLNENALTSGFSGIPYTEPYDFCGSGYRSRYQYFVVPKPWRAGI